MKSPSAKQTNWYDNKPGDSPAKAGPIKRQLLTDEMKRIGIVLILFLFTAISSFGQCAMCRSTLETNLSNGDPTMAKGINIAILYLLAMPYAAVMVLGYFWYKSRK